MHEEWRSIDEFPNYSVSNLGRIRNNATGRIINQFVYERGFLTVGLIKTKRIQFRRSVTVLVAQAFVDQPNEQYNTPMHLDGDRRNNQAENLVWRPRWFCKLYVKQFAPTVRPCFNRKVELIETGQVFANSWDAAISTGALDRDIAFSILNGSRVRVTLDTFCLVK